MFATLRTQVGIAKEATKGTPVAATAFIPVKKIDTTPKVIKLLDEGWRGSMGGPYGMQNGPQSAEVSMSGDVFVDTIGYMLAGVMGDLATTGTASPYTHKVALLNSGDGQPESYTLTDTQAGIQPRQFAGAQFTELGFKYDVSGLMEWDAKALTWLSGTTTAPTPTYGTNPPVPSWIGAVTLGGTAAPNIQSMELTIKRDGAEPVFALGSQNPYLIPVGGLGVEGKIVFVAKDEAPYTQYAGNTTPGALVATFSQGANASIAFTASQPYWSDAKVTRGKSYAELEMSFTAVFNATDTGASAGFGPLTASVINTLPAGTFG